MDVFGVIGHEAVGHVVQFIRLKQDPLLFVNGFTWITFWVIMVTVWFRFIRRIM